MLRNKQPLYYSLYEGKEEITDKYGNLTGQYNVVRSNPVRIYGNVSAAKGEMQSRQFGESETYDKVIVLDDPNTQIDEYAILWIDSLPELDKDGHLVLNDKDEIKTPHDYVVTRKAVSLNSVAIAISKVNVK